jgi:hypothetical protein
VEWRKLCTSLFLDLDLSEFLPYKNKLIGRIETLTKREEKKSERKGRLQKEDKKKSEAGEVEKANGSAASAMYSGHFTRSNAGSHPCPPHN